MYSGNASTASLAGRTPARRPLPGRQKGRRAKRPGAYPKIFRHPVDRPGPPA